MEHGNTTSESYSSENILSLDEGMVIVTDLDDTIGTEVQREFHIPLDDPSIFLCVPPLIIGVF